MKLFVHIGARKTGTTSIQSALKRNEDLLQRNGFFVTNKFENGADNIFPNTFMKSLNYHEQCMAWVDDALASRCNSALISSESLTDMFPNEIETFKRTVTDSFASVTIIFYVRRQDIVATSHFSTGLRGGGTGNQLISTRMGTRGLRGFRYKRVADTWADFYGKSNLAIRVFPDPRPSEWSAVSDILDVIGASTLFDEIQQKAELNVRLDAPQAAYLRRFNLELGSKARTLAPSIQRRFVKFISGVSTGEKLPKPSKSIAENFYSQFRSGNDGLRALYRPDLPAPLFVENFDEYPDDQKSLDEFWNEEQFRIIFDSFIKEFDLSPEEKAMLGK